MKSYNHLYEQVIDKDNIRSSIIETYKNKRIKVRKKYTKIIDNLDYYVEYYYNYATNFKNAEHTPKLIYDGYKRKQRVIVAPTFDEQVVHRMVVNVLKPIFQKSFYYHSYGSIPGKGRIKAMKAIEKRTFNHEYEYCLQLDVKKYFECVPHNILKNKLSRIIHDEDFLKLLFTIIDVQEEGIPIGFYTSQWIANWYLSDLDHYIKEQLHAEFYLRYMDDMIIFSNDKQKLHRLKDDIEKELKVLGLSLKSNWKIFKLERYGKGTPLDFVGFKFYTGKTILRKKIYYRMLRKANKMKKKADFHHYECRQMLSYLGVRNKCNVHDGLALSVYAYMDISELKDVISKFDRREAQTCGYQQVAQ